MSFLDSIKRRIAMEFLRKPISKAVEWVGAALVGVGALSATELAPWVEVNTSVAVMGVGVLLTFLFSKIKK